MLRDQAADADDLTVGTPIGADAACGDVTVGKRKCRRKPHRAPLLAVAPTAWQAREIGWTPDILRDMQIRDGDIAWMESSGRPPWPEVQGQSPMLRSL